MFAAKLQRKDVLKQSEVEDNNDTRRKCTYKRNIEMLSRSHCCSRKAIIITCSEFVSVALIIQHANRMCRIILSSLVCLALPFFPPSHERYDFR
jgi:hypothetical protein